MANIQHRNIPEEGLHEMKGAASALVGSVPVANGVGGTTFQKLGVSSLTGSIPTGIADVSIVTDGVGGFKASESIHAYFSRFPNGFPVTPAFGELIVSQGLFINGLNFQVQVAGTYLITITSTVNISYTVGSDTLYAEALIKSSLYRRDTGTVVGTGGTMIVNLTPGIDYGINDYGTIAVLRVK